MKTENSIGSVVEELPHGWYLRSRLRLRHLQLVADLDETHHLGETARRMATTQPAISKMLAELEDLMGVSLFTRTPKGSFATHHGQTLIRHARWILGDLDRLALDCKHQCQSGRERVVLGVNSSSAADLIPQALLRLRDSGANVSLVVREGSLETLMPQLLTRQLDLVVARVDAGGLRPELCSETLREEAMCVVASHRHPLVQRREVSWSDLADYPWILPPLGSPVRAALDVLSARYGQYLESCFESASVSVNLGLMEHSEHLSILPHGVAHYYQSRGVLGIVGLRLPDIFAPLGLLRDRSITLSAGLKLVIETLHQVAQDEVDMSLVDKSAWLR